MHCLTHWDVQPGMGTEMVCFVWACDAARTVRQLCTTGGGRVGCATCAAGILKMLTHPHCCCLLPSSIHPMQGAGGMKWKLAASAATHVNDKVPERFVVEAKARPDMLRRGGGTLSFANTKTVAGTPINRSSTTKTPNAFKKNGTKAAAGAPSSSIKGKAVKAATGQAANTPTKPVSPATAKALARKAAAGGAAGDAGPVASAKAAAVRGSKGVSQRCGWKK